MFYYNTYQNLSQSIQSSIRSYSQLTEFSSSNIIENQTY